MLAIAASGTPVYSAYRQRDWAMVELLKRHGGIVDPVTIGLFNEVELARQVMEGGSVSEDLLRGFLSGELYRQGLICRADDRGDPVVQLAPPLIADTEQFEEMETILRSVLSQAWNRVESR